MKIVKLEAQNVKRLSAVEITPQGNAVVVGGKNGAGKSSVLDAITYALGGKGAVCEHPVRRGSAKAKVVCELDDMTVTRTFTPTGGGTLTITGKDGAKAASPQALLDKITGSLTFDPLAFASAKPLAQVETLRGLVGLDFTAVNGLRQNLFNERTMVGRDVQGRQMQIDGLPDYPDAPAEEIDIAGLLQKNVDAQNRNAANAAKRRELSDMIQIQREQQTLYREDDDEATREIDQLKGRIAELVSYQKKLREAFSAKAEQTQTDIAKAEKDVAALADIDTAPIMDEISGCAEVNKRVRANATKRGLAESFAKAKAEYARLTVEIDAIDAGKRDKLAAAKFPVEALSFDETGILLNGLPFAQAGSAEQLRVSVAMALALNPTLKIALIRDGSLLDNDSLRMIAEMAEAADAQVWIERVGEGQECQVIIEDGHIKGQEGGEGPNAETE